MIKFSIIIPVFNAAKFIGKCIDSCINQNYKNIEIICVEDCSTDNSKEILEHYQQKDNRIKCVFHLKNESQYIARRNGFLKSSGDYILFLDSDDTLKLNACRLIAKEIKRYNADMVQFGYKLIPKGKKVFPPFYPSAKERVSRYLARENRYSPQVWTKAYKYSSIKKAFDKMEVFYASGSEDLYTSIVFAFYSESFSLLKKPLVNYSFDTGWSRKREYSLPIFSSWLSSYNIVVQKTSAFIKKEIPEFSDKCFDMELYMLKDFIYNRLPFDISPELKGQFFEILPSYFSEEVIHEFFHETSFKSREYDTYLNFNVSLRSKIKMGIKYFILFIKSFCGKYVS